MGIVPSYVDEAEGDARDLIRAINDRLASLGLDEYREPSEPPDVYNGFLFGRSELDHHSASAFQALASLSEEKGLALNHLSLLSYPFRVVFLPTVIDEPFQSDHEDEIWGEMTKVWVGSAPGLLADLMKLGPILGILLSENRLSDSDAAKINDFEPLFEDDDCELAETERTAWLALYEGARMSSENKIALCLAG